MPCLGPTPDEQRHMEVQSNMARFGVEWDDHQLLGNVACAFGKFIYKKEPIPSWAYAWWHHHDVEDRRKKVQAERELEGARVREIDELHKLADKHGFSIRRKA